MGKKRLASPCSVTDTKRKKRRKETDIKKDRHKHKKHSHATAKKHIDAVDSKTLHHKTITLESIPDSLLPHRSLVNFVDDRTKLLEEVFSIFSEEEICNMLPDILKGIKLDEVQKLCHEQLKAMETSGIKQIIQSPGDGIVSSKLQDDISSPEDDKVTSRGQQEASQGTCKHKTSVGLPVASIVEDHSTHTSPIVHDSTSDITDGQVMVDYSNAYSDTPSNMTAEGISRHEDSIELQATVGDDIDRELTLTPISLSSQGGINRQSLTPVSFQEVSDKDRSTSPIVTSVPQEDSGDHQIETPDSLHQVSVTSNKNVCDEALLVELHMRKRALQSQLKKQQLDKMLNEQQTKEELLLRQKALQSLLAASASKKQL